MVAIEAGALDITEEEEEVIIKTSVHDFNKVKIEVEKVVPIEDSFMD
jgi:transcriptional/translational regulatory protein YebC/TACO1